MTRSAFITVCMPAVLAVAIPLVTAGQQQDGTGADVTISGELKQWHKVTLTLSGPPADEASTTPNPFMEAAEDPAFLDAMAQAHIRGALVGVESVTEAGLKDVYKGFNLYGEALVTRLQTFKRHGVHVLGSFIFGLPSDRAETFAATAALAERADITFAQFVMLTPFPGTVDFAKWEKEMAPAGVSIDGIPITRHWLIPQNKRPKVYTPHSTLSADEIRVRTQAVWDRFYSMPQIWGRSRVATTYRARLAFVLISKLYRQMYANTGIATDSARTARAAQWARWIARVVRRLFVARPMPDLQEPSFRTFDGSRAESLASDVLRSGRG